MTMRQIPMTAEGARTKLVLMQIATRAIKPSEARKALQAARYADWKARGKP